jgi:hypothetical protein
MCDYPSIDIRSEAARRECYGIDRKYSPAYILQPELKKMSDGAFHAIYRGNCQHSFTGGDPPVVGIGKTPAEAYDDFNKKWVGK